MQKWIHPSYFGDGHRSQQETVFPVRQRITMNFVDPWEALKSQNKQESSTVFEALVKAAERGDAKSQLELATAYLQGRGVPSRLMLKH